MKQRGRKSDAALEVAQMAPAVARPPPPAHLTPAQAAVWTRVIECERPGFIKSTQYGLLESYCMLEAARNALNLDDAAGRKELVQISLGMHSIARGLRLTNQSRYHPEKAATLANQAGERPWTRAG